MKEDGFLLGCCPKCSTRSREAGVEWSRKKKHLAEDRGHTSINVMISNLMISIYDIDLSKYYVS